MSRTIEASADGKELIITTSQDPIVETISPEILLYRKSDLQEKIAFHQEQIIKLELLIAEIDEQLGTASSLGIVSESVEVQAALVAAGIKEIKEI
jgi:hypothetical protein